MERLYHPNIIRLYEVIETPNEIYIVTEYACGGELYTRISKEGKFLETEAKSKFAQITAAVEHMVKRKKKEQKTILTKRFSLFILA